MLMDVFTYQAHSAARAKAAMIGKRFGLFTVVSHHSRAGGYNCLCDCGNTTVARSSALKSGRHRSCGCLPRRLHEDDSAAKHEVFKNYRASAYRRGRVFSISREDFEALLVLPCHYCDAPPALKSSLKRHPEWRHSGVDRVVNALGYVSGNCVPCCAPCNRAKGTMDVDQWLAWLDLLYQFQHRTTNRAAGALEIRHAQ